MRFKLPLTLLSVTGLLIFSSCDNRDSEDTVEQQAIRKQSQAFEQAFNQKNAQAIADLWVDDATYTEPDSGIQISGRDSIKEDYEELFQNDDSAKIEIHINSINVLSNNTALETGTTKVSRGIEEPIRTAYKAFYEKVKGEWLLTEVREVGFDLPQSNYEHLKELGWLAGDWIDQDQDAVIHNKFEWNDNQNYLTQHFTVTAEGHKIQEGRQIIAWDPAAETIRSWVFDSDGGFGEGTWNRSNDQWFVETAFTLPDGRRASAVNVYTKVNDDSYTWESTGREVDGEILPSIGPVTVERVKN